MDVPTRPPCALFQAPSYATFVLRGGRRAVLAVLVLRCASDPRTSAAESAAETLLGLWRQVTAAAHGR